MADGRNWSLRRELDIPETKPIPKTLLRKIAEAKVGSTIHNPTKTGKRRIHVTRKLRDKAIWTLVLEHVRERVHHKRHHRKHHKKRKKKSHKRKKRKHHHRREEGILEKAVRMVR